MELLLCCVYALTLYDGYRMVGQKVNPIFLTLMVFKYVRKTVVLQVF